MKLKTVRTVQIRGVSALAKKLNRSHVHIGHVLRGNRRAGPELRKAMEAEGFRFDAVGDVIFDAG